MKKKNNYTQLVVWRGTTLGGQDSQSLVDFFKDDLDTRIKFCESVTTLPDIDDSGNKVKGTGGSIDLLFYVHTDDISKFAIKRFQLGGCSWWEDVVKYNNQSHLYKDEILKKYDVTW